MIQVRTFHAKFVSHEDCPTDDNDHPAYSFIYAKMKLMDNKEIVNVRFNLGKFWLPELCRSIDRNQDNVFVVKGEVSKSGTVCVNHLSRESLLNHNGRWLNDSN